MLAAALALVLGAIFVRSVFVLPKLRKPDALRQPEAAFHVPSAVQTVLRPSALPPAWLQQKPLKPTPPIFPREAVSADEPVSLAFYAPWDAASVASLKSHYRQITHVAPEWFSMRNFDEPLVASPDEGVVRFSTSAGVRLLPLLANLDGDTWQPEVVEEFARRPDKRAAFLEKLRDDLQAADASGVLVDWEQVDPAYRSQLTSLLTDLGAYLHEADLELWLCIPVGNDVAAFDLDALAGAVDRFVALLYDENGEDDAPGPIGSLPWWTEWLNGLLAHGTPKQWVVGIGNYGYDWPDGGRATTLGFADVMARARHGGTQPVTAAAPLYHPHFRYAESGRAHSVWFLDAVTFRNQYTLALEKRVGGVALYRLGTEDPSVWQVLADPQLGPPALETLEPSAMVANIGVGDLLTVSNVREPGRRTVTAGATAAWEERYETFPKQPLIYHRGGDVPDQVVLSFDDGPDPLWTPPILDLLKAEDVRAVFFVVGTQAVEHPDLVRRILAEGHEIGNHSYSHPDLSQATAQRTVFELNANQRILEDISGVSTLLFRPPYHADTYPASADEFMTLVHAQDLGYLTVSESIDTQDWDAASAAAILERVRAHRSEGHVILLHDGGGERSATVEALPQIIRYLRQRGDRIVPLQTLLDLPREALMPPIPADDPSESRVVAQAGLKVVDKLEEFAWTFLLATTVVLFVRTGLVVLLALLHRRRERGQESAPVFQGPVSVVIAAYNEAKVIASTVQSVLDTDYRGSLELIVVDDGSTDDTLAILEDLAASDARIRVLSQPNSGKAAALTRALEAARHEVIVTLDADTQLRRDSIRHLLGPLQQPDVGAVSGHIRVGNPTSWIARCQSLEYMCGFNLDRRAYDAWDAITVVPGAASAFRKSAIERAGGIVSDTLAEDTDLTFHLHRAGYRIRYARAAVADTEAPDQVRTLVKQRVRWAFGTLQCLWKHRELLGSLEHPGLGLFSVPSVWFCHVFLVALVPLVDATLLLSLLWGAGASLVGYVLLFFAIEWALALAGCALEGERLRTSLLIFPMRVMYRPLLCFAVWVSLIRALRGAWYGWGKLDRKGTVTSPDPRTRAAGQGRAVPAVTTMAVLLAATWLLVFGPQATHAQTAQPTTGAAGQAPLRITIPKGSAYAGAYIDFGEREDAVTREAIDRFDQMVGRQQAIVAFSSDWGNQAFPDRQLRIIYDYGAVPLVYWSPWDRGEMGSPPGAGRFNLQSILDGKWDAYIDMWATQSRALEKPLLVSWGLEMNGFWFPWSGSYSGRDKPVQGCPKCFAGPETFKRAYRYVVDRVRARGATNIVWVWHANNTSDPEERWNAMAQYYPGPQYADWIAMSAYGTQYASEGWVSVDAAMVIPYTALSRVDETRPIMLAEWGVGEFPKKGDKGKWIAEFLERLPRDFPRIRAGVFWHERWQNADQSISNLRANSSPEALAAYRAGISNPFWLARPLFEK